MIGIASDVIRKQKTTNTAGEFNLLVAEATLASPHLSWITASTLSEIPVWTTRVIAGVAGRSYSEVRHLRRVVSGKRRVVFDKGLVLEVLVVSDRTVVVVSDERFGFYGSGGTYEAALEDYSDFFVDFFEDIVGTPSSNLPASTREFRRTLLAFGKLVQVD